MPYSRAVVAVHRAALDAVWRREREEEEKIAEEEDEEEETSDDDSDSSGGMPDLIEIDRPPWRSRHTGTPGRNKLSFATLDGCAILLAFSAATWGTPWDGTGGTQRKRAADLKPYSRWP